MIIEHAKINWEEYIPKVVKTLILGSFNPNNPGNNANYYYGRNRNYLWKAIGDILFNNQQHFFIAGQLNTELANSIMDIYQFCFLDLIYDLQIIGNDQEHEFNFINVKIFNGFNDNVLFLNNTNFQGNNINIQRNYNLNILEFINIKSPEKLIHTLGNITITQDFASNKPDLNQFLNQLSDVCQQKETDIVPLSISPSQYNIHYNGLYVELKNWLQENLNL